MGAYTLNGTDTCTGALINNTANDRRPFFLTADHCGINAGNAPSMVVFWNFENSTCRTPNTAASGGTGDGDTTQFNTGAILRAGNSITDFTLVELDDPIENDVDAFYAGWDRTEANPESVIGIHHPAVAEKRISFSFIPDSDHFGRSARTSPGDGRFARVVSWDNGTTEGGSSGSPLFDPFRQNHRTALRRLRRMRKYLIGLVWSPLAILVRRQYVQPPDFPTGSIPPAPASQFWTGSARAKRSVSPGNSGSENEVGALEFTISLSQARGGVHTTADDRR